MISRILSFWLFPLLILAPLFIWGQDKPADSLEKLLRSATDTQKVNLLNKIGLEYSQADNILAMNYFNKALSLSRELDYSKGQADALSNIATSKMSQGDYDGSYLLFSSAVEIYQSMNDYSGAGYCMHSMAVIHSRLGNFDKALSFYLSALSLFELENDLNGMGRSFNGIGIVYDQMQQYEKAIFFYEKALNTFKLTENEIGTANTYVNIAIVYNKIGKSEESITLFKQSIEIGLRNNNLRLVSAGYGNIGVALAQEKRYLEALEYQQKAIEIKMQLGDQRGILIGFINVADDYRHIGNQDKALEYLNKAFEIGNLQSAKPELKDAYKLLSEIYASQGSFEKAYQAHLNYSVYVDSIYGEEQKQKMFEAQKKFDLGQLENENTMLRQGNVIDKLNLEKTRYVRNFLIISLSFTFIFIILLVYQYREKRKANVSLQQLNSQLQDVNERLSKSEQHLIEVNASKDQFFSIISHDLRNPLASMVSFVRIMKRDIHNLSKEELDELVCELEFIVDRTGSLLENLLLWSRTQTGRVAYKPELLSLQELVERNVALVATATRNKQIRINVFNNKDCRFVIADNNMTDTIIRNLLGNALKYTPREGGISIGSFLNGDKCVIYIKDNGVGIPIEKQKTLLQIVAATSEDGTEKEKGSGLGLVLCREFVQIQGGEIWFESELGKGTTFYFTLPSGTS